MQSVFSKVDSKRGEIYGGWGGGETVQKVQIQIIGEKQIEIADWEIYA